MSLEDKVEQSYEGTVKESKFKKFAKYSLVGAAALTSMALYSCAKVIDQLKINRPIIYDVNFDFADKIGDIVVDYSVETFEGTQVFVKILEGDDKELFNKVLTGTPKETNGVFATDSQQIDTNIGDSTLVPYKIKIIVSDSPDFSETTTCSTTLINPLPLFGMKAPEFVEKFYDVFDAFVLSDPASVTISTYGRYFIEHDGNIFDRSVDIIEDALLNVNYIVVSDNDGWNLALKSTYQPESDFKDYSVFYFKPPSFNPDMSIGDILELVGINDFEIVDDDKIRTYRPSIIFENATKSPNETIRPGNLIKYYSLPDTTDMYIVTLFKYHNLDPSNLVFSKTPLYTINVLEAKGNWYFFGRETGNVLIPYVDLRDYSSVGIMGRVTLFSPFYYARPPPNREFYTMFDDDAVILDCDWDNRILYFSEIPEESKTLVTQALDELDEVINSLPSP